MTGPEETVMMVLIPPAMRKETPFVGEKDMLIVMAAAYQDVADAEADYVAAKAHCHDVGSSEDFDAAMVARDENGEVTIVKKHEQPTSRGARHRLDWELAVGAACAIFPAADLLDGLAVGGGASAAIGAVTAHIKGGMDDEDLEALANVLGQGQAGLIVVYPVSMADQIAANIKSINTAAVSKKIDADALARPPHETGATS
jgi:uncharacterized membrane protein